MTSSGEPNSSFDEALTRSIRTVRRPLFVGALVALAVLTALALVVVWRQYEDAKDDAAAQLRARAILAATVFDTYFAGQLTALSSIAASPTVVSRDVDAMSRYFARFRPVQKSTFTAGVGWIDLDGRQRATSDPRGPVPVSLADRSYVAEVLATRKPFVSEAIIGGTSGRRLVVMSVPTYDPRGRIAGVLAGGIVLRPSADDARASDLGYGGLVVVDREGQQITRRDLEKARSVDLVTRMRRDDEGVLVDTVGLDGSDGRVVAFASSAAPAWTVVIDQPVSAVFAGARRSLLVESLLIAGAAFVVLVILAWALRRAKRDLRAGRERIDRWATFTRALSEAADTKTVRSVLATALVNEFQAATTLVTLDDPTKEAVDATVERGRRSPVPSVDPGVATWVRQMLADRGSPLVLETREQLRTHAGAGELPPRARALYAASVFERASLAGMASLFFDTELALADHEVALVQAHADQVGQTLVRVRRQEQEHDVAVLLQESLLPEDLPAMDGIQVAAHYSAGVENTRVGGDWYDVVRRPDGIVILTVGDVAGRGIGAAVSMGQLRNAFRAYALDHVSPAVIVRRVARHVPPEGMATMVCVTFDPYTGAVALASAGHVPPLLVDHAAGTVTRETTKGGPLGWLAAGDPRELGLTAAPASTLVLYTDGLVERRGTDLDRRIDELGAAVLEMSGSRPEELVQGVLGRMVGRDADDDLALVVVRLEEAPSVFEIELPAELGELRNLRHRLDRWLDRRGVDEQRRHAAVLAAHEACTNAIEHGYENGPGTIAVRLEQTAEVLHIRIADEGGWRTPAEDPLRGQGIVLMRGLMDRTDIVGKPNGTEVLLEQHL